MDLPFIDEHRVRVAAPAEAVWRALVARIGHGFAAPQPVVRLLGAEPRRVTGTPFGPGSTLPGFTAAEVVPQRLIRLTGRHRFSRYELAFTLTPDADGTVLAARSNAEFPGLPGFLYRSLVIGTGGHRIAVRGLLTAISRASRS